MKRAVQGIAGVLLVLVGVGGVAVGALLLSTFGREGTLVVESGALAGNGTALVTEPLEVGGGSALQQRLGTLTIGARSPDGRPLFLGLASTEDVFRYLENAPYDVVTDVNASGSSTVRAVPGRVLPPPPSQQRFWVASDEGPAPEFTWPGAAADLRLVAMKPDGTRDVAARLTLTYRSTSMYGISLGAMVVGGLAIVLGLVLLVLAALASRRARRERGDVDLGALPPPVPPASGG